MAVLGGFSHGGKRDHVPYGSRARAALAGLLIATHLDMDRHPDRELLERARTALDEALRVTSPASPKKRMSSTPQAD